MGKPRAVTPETFGAWLLKGSRQATPIDALMRTGFSDVTGWCVRPTYRTDLVRVGQPVLFWLSGDDPTTPAGIYAQGVTRGSPTVMEAGGRLSMPVSLQPVEPPILRSRLLHPALSQLEVLKMAAGSNPSYVTRDQVAELRAAWPHLTVADAASQLHRWPVDDFTQPGPPADLPVVLRVRGLTGVDPCRPPYSSLAVRDTVEVPEQTTREGGSMTEKPELPTNPENHPEKTVEALEREAASETGQDEDGVAAEDVTDNPDTGELEGLPGPSPDEPGEPAG